MRPADSVRALVVSLFLLAVSQSGFSQFERPDPDLRLDSPAAAYAAQARTAAVADVTAGFNTIGSHATELRKMMTRADAAAFDAVVEDIMAALLALPQVRLKRTDDPETLKPRASRPDRLPQLKADLVALDQFFARLAKSQTDKRERSLLSSCRKAVKKLLRAVPILLPTVDAAHEEHDAAALGKTEQLLDRMVAEPGWLDSITGQALSELEQSCSSSLSDVLPQPSGERFLNIVRKLLPISNRQRITVRSINCPHEPCLTGLTLGSTIILSSSWLAAASDDDLWAVAAHELAHRPADFARRVVIAYHLGIAMVDQQRLAVDLEIRADQGALVLLRHTGKSPAILKTFLETGRSRCHAAELDVRVSALRLLLQ